MIEEDENLTTMQYWEYWFYGLLFTFLVVMMIWGLYLIHTPDYYCDYPMCIKIGDR